MGRRGQSNRQVTDVVPYQSGDTAGHLGSLLGQAKEKYVEFKEKQDVVKMNENLANSDLEIRKAVNDWKIKNEGDPLNEKALRDLDMQYDQILSKYDKDVSVISRGKWASVKANIKRNNNDRIAQWGIDQVKKNTVRSIEKGIETTNALAYESGLSLDRDGMNETLQNQIDAIRENEGLTLSKQTVDDTIENFKSDNMKSFIIGAIETDVDYAEELLKDKEVKKAIGSPEAIQTLKKVIDNKKKELLVQSSVDQYNNGVKFDENMPDMNVGEQLAELERGKLTGEYNTKWAESREQAILSSKGIDANTQEEYESNIILAIQGAKSIYQDKKNKKNAREYLRDISDVEIKINEGERDGLLSKSDASRLRKSIYKTVTAEAIEQSIGGASWGYQVNDANDHFKNNMGDVDRYRAVKRFFEETDGKDLNNAQKKEIAHRITDEIKEKNFSRVAQEAQNLQSFKTVEEADNSGLPAGTVVLVGGRRYRI